MTTKQSESARERWKNTPALVRRANTAKGTLVAGRKRAASSDLLHTAIAAIEANGGEVIWLDTESTP